MNASGRLFFVLLVLGLMSVGAGARAAELGPAPAIPSPAPTPSAAPLELTPLEPAEAVLPQPSARPQPAPPAHGSFTVTFARYRNDGRIATGVDVQRYLGPPSERRTRAYVNATYGREAYTTLIATSAPAEPPPKKKPKKPPPPKPPVFTPFEAADVSLTTALGVEWRASRSVRFFAQGGPGDERDDGGNVRAGFVPRVGAEWYRPWEPARSGAAYGYADVALNAAGGAFANTALIFDVQHVVPIGRSERSPEFTLRASLAADTRRRFYANVAEVAAGIRIAPLGAAGPSLMLEAVEGRLGIGASMPRATGRTYGALRPSISQSVRL